MIACDSQSCEREWVGHRCGIYTLPVTYLHLQFHLGCVGLTEVPEGEWYCEDCRVDEL